ncbi:MAG: VCBS repeat-containing protein [Myxococcales bacterium]|nr:VCBS repeat-containing protein [Myxococcales bacterium]
MRASPLSFLSLVATTLVSVLFFVGCSCQPDPRLGTDAGPFEDAALDAGTPMEDATVDAGGGPGTPCTASDDCQNTLVCAAGECTPTDGPCTDDTDCGGDTYCCGTGCLPAAETGSVCIPYGTGPRGNLNDECIGDVVIGAFAPSTQCEWTDPPAGDAFPNHKNILATPLVADLPNDSGAAGEIVVVSYNGDDGHSEASRGTDPAYYGVIRILNGQNCNQKEVIRDASHPIIAASPPAIGDLDGDGIPEIVTHRAFSGTIAFKWDAGEGKYKRFWVSSGTGLTRGSHMPSDINCTGITGSCARWDGPSIHDLDDDGFPEVISGTEVFDGKTGVRVNLTQDLKDTFYVHPGVIAIVGDVDADGIPDLVGPDVYTWNKATKKWDYKYPGVPSGWHFAYADFGTPGATPGDFNRTVLDGKAEIVSTGASEIYLSTLSGQTLLHVDYGGSTEGGGPPTIGDFDNDGFPEIATAWRTAYRIFDLECTGAGNGCEAKYTRWSKPTQDATSNRTGSSVFDFEGDGQAEAIYGDECWVRVYDGKTGEVLYSAFRNSCTWYENPVIADPDKDSNTEILVASNDSCIADNEIPTCPAIDPVHRGELCQGDEDCFGGDCVAGYCRCANDNECPTFSKCTAPPGGTPGTGKTCRAAQGSQGLYGLVVLRDRLDRWASSRAMWNQHAYSVTNVNDDGTIPQTSTWKRNYTEPGLNNYRQNVQGETGAEDFPDITGRTTNNLCQRAGGKITLNATVCNRGYRAVGAALPATFYKGDPADGEILCVSYTEGPVPVGGCLGVSCEIAESVDGKVTMVVNDDGQGGRTTVECNDQNNEDSVTVISCLE